MLPTIREKIFTFLKDSLFPRFCFVCKSEGELFCEKCKHTFELSIVADCPVCHEKSLEGKPCRACQSQTLLQSHMALFSYKDKKIAHILHEIKYHYVEEYFDFFRDFISQYFRLYRSAYENIDIIAFVPLHKRRYAERGFNQAKVFADMVADELDLPCESVIERKRYTKQQMKLKRENRLHNLKEAFFIPDNTKIMNKNILLVDDVFTTGSTLGECAKQLKNAGARHIYGFSIGRG